MPSLPVNVIRIGDALLHQPLQCSILTPRKVQPTTWVYNDKIKTCKCAICGFRVRIFSLKCDSCGIHICSECQDLDSERQAVNKIKARHHIDQGCWPCRFPSNMHPDFAMRYLDYEKMALKWDIVEMDLQKLQLSKKSLAFNSLRRSKVANESNQFSAGEEDDLPARGNVEEFGHQRNVSDNEALPQGIPKKRKRAQVECSMPESMLRTTNVRAKQVTKHSIPDPTSRVFQKTLQTIDNEYVHRFNRQSCFHEVHERFRCKASAPSSMTRATLLTEISRICENELAASQPASTSHFDDFTIVAVGAAAHGHAHHLQT